MTTIRPRFGALALGSLAALMLAMIATIAPASAQTPTPGGDYTARIVSGPCSDPDATTAYDLNPVSLTTSDDDDNDDDDNDDAPSGAIVGSTAAVPVAASGTQLNVSLDTVLAQPHAIVLSSGADPAGATVVACGEIGGQLRGSDDLIIGLTPNGDSGVAGIAFLDGDDDDNQLDVTVYLVSWSDTLTPANG